MKNRINLFLANAISIDSTLHRVKIRAFKTIMESVVDHSRVEFQK